MNLKPLLTNCIIGLILINTGIAQSLKAPQNFIQNKDWGFLPNQGQLADGQGNVLTDIKYYTHQAGVQLYCRANKISFVFTKVEHEESNISEAGDEPQLPKALKQENHQNDKIYASRADMVLIGANPNPTIVATGQQPGYENYYLGHTSEDGITNTHAYKTLTYQNIYPHIDLVLHSKPTGIKYEYIVRPGGKISDIQMQWYGLASAQLSKSGGITYSMRLDNDKIAMEESAPLSFTSSGKVASSFIKQGNRTAFKVDNYDHNETLTIDPELNWGTFFGGNHLDYGIKIKTDASGNVIITGYTYSTNIATSGAFQTSLAGIYDLYIAKFSNTGWPIWCTYYGTSGGEQPQGLAIDASGNIYVSGFCTSSGLATSGAYHSYFSGSNDGFLAKFSNAGSRLWATYIGGSADDYAAGLAVDASGNVFVTGQTRSTGIATSGAYLSSYNSSNYTTYIAKFSSSGSLSWATYFGSDANTFPAALDVDKSGNVFVTGYTLSYTIATAGSYQSALASEYDAYLAKFSNSGSLAWATYFGGSSSDYTADVVCDASGNVIIGGYTTSKGLASAGAYQTSTSGNNFDAFFAKFNTNGALSWATYFGGDQSEILYGMCTDVDQSIYICGGSSSTDGIATANAYQSSLAGSTDVFMAKFNKNGNIAWGTYYGGTGQDYAYGICTDAYKNIYVTGYTNSTDGIASANAYQPIPSTSTAGTIHAIIARFSRPLPNNAGLNMIKSPAARICAINTDTKVSLQNYSTQTLNSLTIGWTVDGVTQNDYHWTGNLAPGDTVSVSLNNPRKYSKGVHGIKIYCSQPNGAQDSMPGNDTLKESLTCNAITSADWTMQHPDKSLNYHFQVNDSSQMRTDYTWILGDGFNYNGYSFSHTFANTGPCDVKLITFNTFGCVNVKDSSLQVALSGISPTPSVDLHNINIYPNPFRDKTIIHFNNPQASTVKISINDMLGKVLYTSAAKQYSAGDNTIEINAEEAGLSTGGTYFVSIMIGEDMLVRKLVVTGR